MSSNFTNVSLVANRTDQTELSPTDVTMQLIFGSMMLVFGLIGVVGNVVALYAFCRTRSLRRPKNYVVANLCLTDMFVCLVYCPIIVSRSFSHGSSKIRLQRFVTVATIWPCHSDLLRLTPEAQRLSKPCSRIIMFDELLRCRGTFDSIETKIQQGRKRKR